LSRVGVAGGRREIEQESAKDRRERRAEIDPFAGARLREAEAGGVEEIAFERRERALVDFELRGGAVERVANHRMMERGKVDADLVGAAGVELDFEERCWADAVEHTPVCAGCAGAIDDAAARGHADATIGVACDSELDAAFRFVDDAFDQREVGLFHQAIAEGFAEFAVGGVVFGDEDNAGGFFVEAVDDAGAEYVAALGERLAAAQECVDHGAGMVAGSRVDNHACGLVDGEDVVVFIQEVERDAFGLGLDRGARLDFDGDTFAAVEAVRGFGRFAVEQDVGFIDEFLNAGAAEVGAMRSDDAVEALTGVVGRNDEVVSHGRSDSNAGR